MSDFAIQWFQTFPDPKVFQSKTPSAMSQCHGRFINSDSRSIILCKELRP